MAIICSFLIFARPLIRRRKIRKTVIEMVLATDLSLHVELLSKWHRYTSQTQPLTEPQPSPASNSAGSSNGVPCPSPSAGVIPGPPRVWESKQSPEERMLTLKVALKTADVSYTAKNGRLHNMWAERMMKEFHNQGDMEKAIGLPVSPFMNRLQPQTKLAQRAYIKWIARPLWTSFAEFIHLEMRGDEWKRNMEQNYALYADEPGDGSSATPSHTATVSLPESVTLIEQ